MTEQPRWKVNMLGIRGALGWYDPITGEPIIVMNGWGLINYAKYGRKRDMSAKREPEDFSGMTTDVPGGDRHESFHR